MEWAQQVMKAVDGRRDREVKLVIQKRQGGNGRGKEGHHENTTDGCFENGVQLP